ncbi:MAG: non-canonical purine NTP pyrophosphatase, partial [Chlamydiia bacterium]|nr:non-canonical purine NTP pyrophosphatase [Chlamydiia bacterium]
MRKMIYATGNEGKFREAKLILSEWELEQRAVDIPEIQGDREEVTRAKALATVAILGEPCIVEDVSLFCPALNGFPGPYAKCFVRTVGLEKIYKILETVGDCRVTAICTAAYVEPGCEPILFEGELHGQIVPPKGTLKVGKYSFNAVFMPDGYERTLGVGWHNNKK